VINLRRVLNKVFPKLHAIEEMPTVTVLKEIQAGASNPFEETEPQYEKHEVKCIYSEEPEMVLKEGVLVTSKAMFLYIKTIDMPELTMRDQFMFRNQLYVPTELQDIFGLWRIRVATN
jgi:hypothetical protein